MAYSVRTKRIYEPKAADDGKRILVDRLWPRGVSKEEAGLDLWLKEVAPSTPLRKWFGHRPDRWDEFRRRYFSELEGSSALAQLRDIAHAGPVTLLYGAKDEIHNQATALAACLEHKAGPASK
jgi:uncharacterized protein YeaO (DUF488 family)